MDWLRIFAAVLPALCGAYTGVYYSKKLRGRSESLKDFIMLTDELKILIQFGVPMNEIFSRLTSYEFVREMSLTNSGADFRAAWRTAAERIFTDSERGTILTLGGALGGSGTAGQISLIDTAQALLRKNLDAAQAEYAKKGQMYRSVGLMCGLIVSIIIL